MKRCKTCGETKPFTEFSTNGRPKDGLTQPYRPSCKPCTTVAKRVMWAAATPEEITRRRERATASYQRNKASHIAATKRWAENNPERIREIRRDASRRFRLKDIEKTRFKGRRDQLSRRLGRDAEAVRYAEIVRRDPCSYCGEPSETVDHIVALGVGGSNDWTNLTGACTSCNSSKRAQGLLWFLLRRAERPTEVVES